MKQKGAIFDMDGTLLDSTWVWEKVDQVFHEKMAIQAADGYYNEVVHMTPTQLAHYTIKQYHLSVTADELKVLWVSIAEELYKKEVRLKEGACEWLQYLKSQGVKLGIATSCFRSLCESALQSNGILELFDCICIADELGHSKEDAALYLRCAKAMEVEANECMVFEDISRPLRKVKENHMYYIGVKDRRQSASTQKELEKYADLYIENFSGLETHPYFS